MRKIVILPLFILLLYIFTFTTKALNLPFFGKVIYIDPGHGGIDPGALYKDIKESKINLEISIKLMNELERNGAIVYLTRYDDYDLSVKYALQRKRSDLSRRANIINNSLCDLYLSIHLNADISNTWKGAQVFYDDVNEKNELIASIIQKSFMKNLKTKREYKEIKDNYMYPRIKRPGVLIEAGFISNPNERYLLQRDDYQKRIVLAIVEGLKNYF